MRSRYALPADAESRLAGYLERRTEGNPFYAGEVLRAVEEAGTLVREGDGWLLGGLAEVGVPTLLRQVIDARLDRLGEEARNLLAVAAIIGQEVPIVLWVTVAGADEDTLLGLIERAAEARLMDPTAEGMRFAHALIREALYEGTLPIRRRLFHRRAAEALAVIAAPDPDTMAYHFKHAGDERTAVWLVRAGERAQRAHAILTAAERYEAASVLMESAQDQVPRGWLLYRLALLRRHTHPRHALEAADEANTIALAAGDCALAAATRFVRGIHLANHHFQLEELTAGIVALEALAPADLIRLNEADGLPASADRMTWRGQLVAYLSVTGRFAEALAMGEEFIATTSPPTMGELLREHYFGGAYFGLGIAYAMLGQPERSRHAFAAAHAIFHLIGSLINVDQIRHTQLTLVLLPFAADDASARAEFARGEVFAPIDGEAELHKLSDRLPGSV